MLTRLYNGNKIIFLPNLLKDGTYGDIIVEVPTFFLQNSKGSSYITENPKLPIFKTLYDLKFRERTIDLTIISKYYSYAFVNGEYKLIYFGRTIKELIKNSDLSNIELNVVIKKGFSGFDNYDDSYLSINEKKVITEDLLKTKTLYIEDIVKSTQWTNEKQYNILVEYFKEKNINLDPIKEITQKRRELKLGRILQKDYTKDDIFDIIKFINPNLEEKQINKHFENWLNQ